MTPPTDGDLELACSWCGRMFRTATMMLTCPRCVARIRRIMGATIDQLTERLERRRSRR